MLPCEFVDEGNTRAVNPFSGQRPFRGDMASALRKGRLHSFNDDPCPRGHASRTYVYSRLMCIIESPRYVPQASENINDPIEAYFSCR
jgi:hypothetical protein